MEVVVKYCNVCVSVCPRAYLPNHMCIFCACCLSPWLGPTSSGWQNLKVKGQFFVFLKKLIDKVWYSITFGIHTKTAEPIEMLFGMITSMGPRYHVLNGGPDPHGRGNFEGIRSGPLWSNGTLCGELCKLKTAEPIENPFLVKTGGPKKLYVRLRCRYPTGRSIFGSCSGHSKALAVFAAAFAAKWIIQSLITSCNRRDHSVCLASANSILKISGRRQCGLSAAKEVMGLHSTGEVWYCLVYVDVMALTLSFILCLSSWLKVSGYMCWRAVQFRDM